MKDVIFVLEDMTERMPVFERIAKEQGMGLFHVDNVSDAKKHFLEIDPKMVFLDHDLGGKIFVNSEKEETGVHLAQWIAAKDSNFKKRLIIIHSMNPGGALNIYRALDEAAYYVPITEFSKRSHRLLGIFKKLDSQ